MQLIINYWEESSWICSRYTFVCSQIQQDIQMKTNEIQREGRKKDRLERDLRQANADLDTKVVEIKNLQQNLEQSTNNVAKLNSDLKDQKVRHSVVVLLIFNNGYLLWNRILVIFILVLCKFVLQQESGTYFMISHFISTKDIYGPNLK